MTFRVHGIHVAYLLRDIHSGVPSTQQKRRQYTQIADIFELKDQI